MATPKKPAPETDESSPFVKGGEFKSEADEANKRISPPLSLSNTDWADLPSKEREKKQRG